MIKFDLEKALAGEKVITRDGREVTQITKFKGVTGERESIYATLNGVVMSYYETGEYTLDRNIAGENLFMAPKKLSGFINLYDNGDVGQIIHNTKHEATCGRSGIKNRIACIDLSQFEEGHGL
jgi:hypothetical protein